MLLKLITLLLLSHFSRVRLCAAPETAAHQAPVPGILQARTLEWVAISFSNAWKWKVKVKSLSHLWLLAIPWTAVYQALPSMGFSRQEYWSGLPLPSPKLITATHQNPILVSWPSLDFRFDLVLSCLFLTVVFPVQDTRNCFGSYMSFMIHVTIQVSMLVLVCSVWNLPLTWFHDWLVYSHLSSKNVSLEQPFLDMFLFLCVIVMFILLLVYCLC